MRTTRCAANAVTANAVETARRGAVEHRRGEALAGGCGKVANSSVPAFFNCRAQSSRRSSVAAGFRSAGVKIGRHRNARPGAKRGAVLLGQGLYIFENWFRAATRRGFDHAKGNAAGDALQGLVLLELDQGFEEAATWRSMNFCETRLHVVAGLAGRGVRWRDTLATRLQQRCRLLRT